MNEIFYRIREDRENGQTSYGVEVWENNVLTEYIPNVFTEKGHAEKLVNTCNSYKVPSIHIRDIIENMYFEIYHTSIRL